MKTALHLIIVFVVLQMGVCAGGDISTKTIDQDPTTMAEFQRVVEDAAANDTIRVRFPSGEWNWYCTGHIEIPQKENLSKWVSNANSFDKEALGKWLDSNKVAAVQLLFGSDIDPKTYFVIEKILRARKIPYWVISLDAANVPRQSITLYETNGTARVLPRSDNKGEKQDTAPNP